MERQKKKKAGTHYAYPSYKESDIEWLGEVPERWGLQRLKYVFLFSRGVDLSADNFVEGPYPVCASNGIIGYHDKYSAKGPSIIVGRSGSVGEVNYIESNFWAHNTALFVTKFYKAIPRYCYYLLLVLDLKSLSAGTAVGTLNRNYIHDLAIAVPSTEEQEAISLFLDGETVRIDQLIARKEKQIELLQEKRSALISHAVTKGLNPKAKMKDSGIEWLGVIPEHWEVKRIKFTSDLIDGDRGKEYPNENDLVDDGIPFLSTSNIVDHHLVPDNLRYITEEKFNKLSRGKLQKNDLIVTMRGTIGNTALFESNFANKAFINAQMIIVRSRKNILAKYLFYYSLSFMWSEQLDLYSYGTAQQQLSHDILANIAIPLPLHQEQQTIVDFLDHQTAKIRFLMHKIQTSIDKLREYRIALISAAVTGKIDVRKEAA